MYIGSIHILYASKLFKYHVFVFICVLEKSDFHFKNLCFGKYRFSFSAKFVSHKNDLKSLKFILKFFTKVCISMYYAKTIFVDF